MSGLAASNPSKRPNDCCGDPDCPNDCERDYSAADAADGEQEA